jgi:small acid-soluble spore protein (thioredoxin-like protein)
MKRKPVDRDSVQKIQKSIEMTKHNIEIADELIAATDNKKVKNDLKDENERRTDAVHAFKRELRDESTNQKNGYS